MSAVKGGAVEADEEDMIAIVGYGEDLTDAGNALRLVKQHGKNFHWVSEWKSWIVWDGARWKRDDLGIMQLAKDAASLIFLEARAQGSDDKAKTVSRWANTSRGVGRLKAMVELAKDEPGVAVSASDLDANPWLLVFKNGTFDFKAGELREARREDLLTMSTGHDYVADAECPSVDDFLKWVTNGRGDLQAEVLRLMGYTLVGSTQERVMLILYGDGNNGKSTLIKLLQAALGDYAKSIPMATLEKQRFSRGGGSANPDVIRVKGARFVSSLESEEGMPISAAMVKVLASSDTITARDLFEKNIDFTPQHTLWLATNHKPKAPANDDAFWRRVRLVPFDAYVPPSEANLHLDDELAAEVTGFLARLVSEAVEWHAHGLLESVETKEATVEWREQSDTFKDFVEWLGEWTDSEPVVPVDMGLAALHETYQREAKRNDWPVLDTKEFKKHMEQHHFTATKKHPRVWVWPEVKPQHIDYRALAASVAPRLVDASSTD